MKKTLSKVFNVLTSRDANWMAKSLRVAFLVSVGLSSMKYIIPELIDKRALNDNEISMLKSIFKDSLDYDKIRISKSKNASSYYRLTSGAEAQAMGNTVIMDAKYIGIEDFSATNSYYKEIFTHEIAHIWQYQNNIDLSMLSSMKHSFQTRFTETSAYSYVLEEGKKLTDYNHEQQATIITDYYLNCREGNLGDYDIGDRNQNKVSLYKSILSGFLEDNDKETNLNAKGCQPEISHGYNIKL